MPGLASRLTPVCGMFLLSFCAVNPAYAQYSLSAKSMDFGNTTVGLHSAGLGTVVTNTSTSPVSISSMSITGAGFYLAAGVAPDTLQPNQHFLYEVYFIPPAAGSYSGELRLVIDGKTAAIPLTGAGIATHAAVSVSASSMLFGPHPIGTTTPVKKFTITNTGSGHLTVQDITTNPPFRIVGFSQAVTLSPGQSTGAGVSFFAGTSGGWSGTVLITYDVLPATGISLGGAATTATSFGIATYPGLPAGTVGHSYLAALESAGGVGHVTWSVLPGTGAKVLPPGLSLSSTGTVSGTIASSAAIGTYSPVIEATDSATPPNTATLTMTLAARRTTGAACGNISWNVAGTSKPLLSVHDLSTGTYFGVEGGLYPDGKNIRPASHDADGVALAKSIQPLDADGNPSPAGKYVFMSLGISTGRDTWIGFSKFASADPDLNPHLVLVNGAEPDGSADKFAIPSNPFWQTILNHLLPNSGVTAKQVVAIWYQDLIMDPKGTFPSDMVGLQNDIEAIMQNLHTFFPYLKLVYLSPWPYSGYCNGYQGIILEPYGYENGFAVKNAIGEQLNGLPALNYSPNKGPVRSLDGLGSLCMVQWHACGSQWICDNLPGYDARLPPSVAGAGSGQMGRPDVGFF